MLPMIDAEALSRLLDPLPGVVFVIKDLNGRYLHANVGLVRRLGLCRREELIGRYVSELFPGGLGLAYAEQDRRVLAGESLHDHLELHLYPHRQPGWCLSSKYPLRGKGESIARIAQACGFADYSAFAREFRVMVGVAPSEFRRLRGL